MTSRTTRYIGLLLGAAALVGLGISMPEMLTRLENRAVPMVWFGEATDRMSFELLGDDVTIETLEVAQGSGEAHPFTRLGVSWKGIEHEVEIQQAEDERLPGLLRYGDWVKVVPMAVPPSGEVGGQPRLMEMLGSGEIAPELLIAVRQLPEGFDPETWGKVRRKAWHYRFLVLSTDAHGHPASRVIKRNYGEMQDLTEALFLSLDFEHGSALKGGPDRIAGDLAKVRKAHGVRPNDADLWSQVDAVLAGTSTGEQAVARLRVLLEDRFWQYQAMLLVTPKLQHPRTKVVDYGISSMGWTWPVAGASALALTLGVFLVMSSWVKRDDDLPVLG